MTVPAESLFLFADLILPLPLNRYFTYRIPSEFAGRVHLGSRVIVSFGQKKFYTGIVVSLHHQEPEAYETKVIEGLCEDHPIVLRSQLQLWKWQSEYYQCSPGEVFRAAVPSGFLNEDKEERFKPRKESFVRLAFDPTDEVLLADVFQKIKRSLKQEQLLLHYFRVTQSSNGQEFYEISLADLLRSSESSRATMKGLVDKGLLEVFGKEVSRLTTYHRKTIAPKPLSPEQSRAYTEIIQSFRSQSTVLLYGVTASGKTEIYIRLIQAALDSGKQVLFLLPEIALTTQITDRLQQIFGNRLGVYHSKFSNSERVELWNKQLSSQPFDVIVGARSALFVPYQRLGLVIVDEEHEQSYKQHDPAPRYHAKNSAVVLASFFGAKTLLGSATPSIESYHRAQTGKYGLVELTSRYRNVAMPRIEIIDVKELRRRKLMKSEIVSPPLRQAMAEALEAKEQVILFQNRRGYSSYIECAQCGWIPKCRNCDVSLTQHRGKGRIVCHYCGYTEYIPSACPKCHHTHLYSQGIGTEKIEDEVLQLFPEAKILRMDLDTTRKKHSLTQIIEEFQSGEADILIGTQMVAKGLDFSRVSVVGIVNADLLFHFPDFRAHERAFQLLSQVSGRAGRSGKQGRVLLQTSHSNHPLLPVVLAHDYKSMYEQELSERKLFRYPPFYRIIYLNLKHRKEDVVERCAIEFAEELRKTFGSRILGPDTPPVSRVQTYFVRKIIIKAETQVSMPKVKERLNKILEEIIQKTEYRGVQSFYDVDPQ